MDQEQINQYNENLATMNESIRLMNDTLSKVVSVNTATINSVNKLNAAINGTDNELDKLDKGLEESGTALRNLSTSAKDARKAQAERDQALENSYKSAKNALGQFADTLLFNSEKGFSKFSGGLTSAGDAAFELGKSFGLFGGIIGGIIKMGTVVADVFMKQADAQNAFVTDMYKMGAISGQSSENLTDLARAAGYSAGELDKLVPSLKAAGQGLATLGKTTGEGTGTLLQMFNVGNDMEQQYFRLGYSLEELNKTQADYIELQRVSGVNLRASGKDAKDLRKESLEYAKNLRVLSDLTGKSAETLQQEQMAAQGAYENVIASRQAEAEIRQKQAELANETNQERRAQLEEEIAGLQNAQESRNKAIGEVANTFGQDFGEQFGRILRTGSFDQFTGELAPLFAQAGLDPASLQKQFEGVEAGSEEFNTLMSNVVQDLRQGADKSILQYGEAIQFGGEELGRALGLAKQFVLQSGIVDPELEQQRRDASRAEIDATMGSRDAQRNYAAAVETYTRDMRVLADAMLDEINPLTGEFNALRGVTTGLAIAAVAATAALGALSALNALKGLTGVLNRIPGLGASIGNIGTTIAGGGLKAAGAMTGAAGALAAAAYGGWQLGSWLNEKFGADQKLSRLFTSEAEEQANIEMERGNDLEEQLRMINESRVDNKQIPITPEILQEARTKGITPDELIASMSSATVTPVSAVGTTDTKSQSTTEFASNNTEKPLESLTELARSSNISSTVPDTSRITSAVTPETVKDDKTTATGTTTPVDNSTLAPNDMLIVMLSQKLDIMIEKLNESVDIQDRSFRYNMG